MTKLKDNLTFGDLDEETLFLSKCVAKGITKDKLHVKSLIVSHQYIENTTSFSVVLADEHEILYKDYTKLTSIREALIYYNAL